MSGIESNRWVYSDEAEFCGAYWNRMLTLRSASDIRFRRIVRTSDFWYIMDYVGRTGIEC